MSSVKPYLAMTLAFTCVAQAEVVFDGSPGSGPPPATLGRYTMIPFPPDDSPIFTPVGHLETPIGGTLGMSPAGDHRRVGAGWATWSHGYTGDLYAFFGGEATLSMPPETGAFYFYAEPGPFSEHFFTAVTDDGTTSGLIGVHGQAGAKYFGFYTTDGSAIASITVNLESSSSISFAIGEFAIAERVPGVPGDDRTLFVDDNNPVGADGGSWNRAFKNLQDALAAASGDLNVKEIRVAGGVYWPDQDASGSSAGDRSASFRLQNGLAIRGGYRGLAGGGDADDRDLIAFESVLSGDLNGDDGPGFTNYGDNSYHVVRNASRGRTAVLDGFTIAAGNADGTGGEGLGGGMYNQFSLPTIVNCTFTRNFAVDGGGMANQEFSDPLLDNCTFVQNASGNDAGAMLNIDRSKPTLARCLFHDNSAGSNGGAMLNVHDSDPILSDCLFQSNTAVRGAAILNTRGTGGDSEPVLTQCSFDGNSASDDGGAVYNAIDCDPQFLQCRFSANTAVDRGGAIYDGASRAVLADCTFAANSAHDGGAMSSDAASDEMLTNCQFLGNSATVGGGAMHRLGGFPIVTNCLFTRNVAQYAGGIFIDGDEPELASCILWGNADSEGAGELAQIRFFPGSDVTVFYSCIEGLLGLAGNGNIGDDPQFADPTGPDGDADTFDDNDYHLGPDSPAINKGDPTVTVMPGETDFDGHARVLCGRVDMGPYEFGIGDFDCDRVLDLTDFVGWPECMTGPELGPYGAGCEAFDFGFDGDVDLEDFSRFQIIFE